MASAVEIPNSTQQKSLGGGRGVAPLYKVSSGEHRATGSFPLPTPHRPSPLRHSIPPAAGPVSVRQSTFSIVIGSPPKSQNLTQSETSGTSGNHYGTSFVPPLGASRGGAQPNATAKSTLGSPSKQGSSFKDSRATPLSQSIPKKRGRPFQTSEAAAKAAARELSDNEYPKKRGRPFKYPKKILEVIPPEPNFMPFLCEWEDCPAELHNLETLRRHVFTVHKKLLFGIPTCLWEKCSQKYGEVTQIPTRVDKRLGFRTLEEWRNHINEAHLEPIAWYMGDGPRGTDLRTIENLQPETCPSYLCDATGRQVTPSVEHQPIEEGLAKINNATRFVKRREGLDIVLEPISPVEAYLRLRKVEEDD